MRDARQHPEDELLLQTLIGSLVTFIVYGRTMMHPLEMMALSYSEA